MSGIDKIFDYLVPASMRDVLKVGDKVRVNLHGRRVGGWVVALGEYGSLGFSDVSLDKLVEITKRSGQGVVSHLVPLSTEIASYYLGPLRAVLQSASSKHVTRSKGRPHHGITSAQQVRDAKVHVVVVAPLDSVLSVVVGLAQHGSVLVVCPTVRMAVLGAAFLRRRGCTVALMPDDWDQGLDGVDVAIGARSAVWSPLADISAIVVVDEHDDSLKEERVPTWHAREVAIRRARMEDIPCYLCSSVPSAEAMSLVRSNGAIHETLPSTDGWPLIEAVDLSDVPVAGSLASTRMLQLVKQPSVSVLCILNTKGKARLLACAKCRTIVKCPQCSAAMASTDERIHHCGLCGYSAPAVCSECGRTAFRVLRSGIGRLREEIAKSSGREVVEVDSGTEILDLGRHDGVYIGTEALLHRVAGAQHVVFLDFDSELLQPRATAARDAMSLVIRAARVVGRGGSIILQSHQIHHELVAALTSAHLDASSIEAWQQSDDAMRKLLVLPPYTSLARLRLDKDVNIADVCDDKIMTWAQETDNTYLVRSHDTVAFRDALLQAREKHSHRIRVDIDPTRY